MFSQTVPSHAQLGYLKDTLEALNSSLESIGQTLIVEQRCLSKIIEKYQANYNITHIGSSEQCGFDEIKQWNNAKEKYSQMVFSSQNASTLFNEQELPFTLDKFPKSFTSFRKKVEMRFTSFKNHLDWLNIFNDSLFW